jgi:hypothetical protein
MTFGCKFDQKVGHGTLESLAVHRFNERDHVSVLSKNRADHQMNAQDRLLAFADSSVTKLTCTHHEFNLSFCIVCIHAQHTFC